MKKITIIDEEIEAILDSAVFAKKYYKYPKEQAYGLYISDLIREVRTLQLCQCRQCMSVPPHCHPPAWLFSKVEEK